MLCITLHDDEVILKIQPPCMSGFWFSIKQKDQTERTINVSFHHNYDSEQMVTEELFLHLTAAAGWWILRLSYWFSLSSALFIGLFLWCWTVAYWISSASLSPSLLGLLNEMLAYGVASQMADSDTRGSLSVTLEYRSSWNKWKWIITHMKPN